MPEKPIPIVHQAIWDTICLPCPRCGGPIEGYTCVREKSVDDARKSLGDLIDEPPGIAAKDGDLCACIHCTTLLIFTLLNGQLGLRAMNRREIMALKKTKKWALIQRTREAIREAYDA